MGKSEYFIRSKTADYWLAGTDNWVKMRLMSDKGETDWFRLKGDHERNETDDTNIVLDDIGAPQEIEIDVSGDLADKWYPYSIEVWRGPDEKDFDGYSKFLIDQELGYDPTKFSANSRQPEVGATPSGPPRGTTREVTLVFWGNNLTGNEPMPGSQTKNYWSRTRDIGVSKTDASTFDAGVKVGYSYGNKDSFHHVSAEAWMSIKRYTEQKIVENDSTTLGGEIDNGWTIAAGQATLRKVKIVAKYMEQVLVLPDNTKRIVQWPTGEMQPPAFQSQYSVPPRAGKHLKSFEDIEEEYLQYMALEDASEVRELFIANRNEGWLTMQKPLAPPKPGTIFPLRIGTRTDLGITVRNQIIKNNTPIILHAGFDSWLLRDDGAIVRADDPKLGLTVFYQKIKNGSRIILHQGYNRWTIRPDGSIVLKDNPQFGLAVRHQRAANNAQLILHKKHSVWTW